MDQAQKQGSAFAWKLPDFPDRTTGSWPFEVERKAPRLGPQESSIGASRVGPLVTPAAGLPLAPGAGRPSRGHQVSGPISINAPQGPPRTENPEACRCKRRCARRLRYQARVDARRIASSERVTSSSVVDQLLTEIRSTRRPCHVDPLIQAVPSSSSLAST